MRTIVVACVLLIDAVASAADFYVAPGGNDANPGTLDKPFATLTRARDAARTLKKDRGPLAETVRVNVADGTYAIVEPLVFSPEDGGTKDAPVVYQAMPGTHPVFSGGRVMTGWQPNENGLWATRLPQAAAGKWRFEQLFVNGRRATRARTPNESYFFMQDICEEVLVPGSKEARQADKARQTVRMRVEDFEQAFDKLPAEDLSDVALVVYQNWDVARRFLDSIDRKQSKFVTSGKGMKLWNPWRRNTCLHLENYFAALDAPGEWFLARDGWLFYKPLPGEDMSKAMVVAPVADKFLVIQGDSKAGKFAEHIAFKGLTFQHGQWRSAPGGFEPAQAAAPIEAVVMVDAARNVTIEDCEIGHVGTYAVWFRKGCRDCAMRRTYLYDFGAGGVRIGEATIATRNEERTSHITVENNIIHHGGYIFPCAVGVWIGQSGDNTVTHNDIADLSYTGISVGWRFGYAESLAKRNTIAFNHVHHIGRGVLSDLGGIYTLGPSEGTVVQNNVFHDIYACSYGGWGMYADEGSSGILFESNLVYRTKTGGFHQHYGKENIVRNNIFAFNKLQQIQATRAEDHLSFTLEKNIIYWDTGTLLSGPWDKLQYSSQNNCFWDARSEPVKFINDTLDAWQAKGHEQGSQIVNPRFANPKADDFRLPTDSPTLKVGFKSFDPSQAGVYGDPEWIRKATAASYPPLELVPDSPAWEIVDDFEATDVGRSPRDVEIHVENKGDAIVVTAEAASSGKQCVKVTDAHGLRRVYNPHMVYRGVNYESGRVLNSFDLRIEPKTFLRFEWRDDSKGSYYTGPQFQIRDGRLQLGKSRTVALPVGKWVKFEVAATLGNSNQRTWALRLTIAGRRPLVFCNLPYARPEFNELTWVGFMSAANEKTAFYLDAFTLRGRANDVTPKQLQ